MSLEDALTLRCAVIADWTVMTDLMKLIVISMTMMIEETKDQRRLQAITGIETHSNCCVKIILYLLTCDKFFAVIIMLIYLETRKRVISSALQHLSQYVEVMEIRMDPDVFLSKLLVWYSISNISILDEINSNNCIFVLYSQIKC